MKKQNVLLYMGIKVVVTVVTVVTTASTQAWSFKPKRLVTTGDSGDNLSGDKMLFSGDKRGFSGDTVVTFLRLALILIKMIEKQNLYLNNKTLASIEKAGLSPLSPLFSHHALNS